MFPYTQENEINLAARVRLTHKLGPGNRAALWVRGCLTHCPGCIAPDWQEFQPEHWVGIEALADELILENEVDGLTISGGEPFLQANALSKMLRYARSKKEFNVISFSGYTLEHLRSGQVPHADQLLSLIDVLIDGPYIASKNNNRSMFGSANQKVHYLSDRLRFHDFENRNRDVEIRIEDGFGFLIGVPHQHVETAFRESITKIQNQFSGGEII
ncbi:MAG: radical SAM protein [Anaerolineaceae bacterium]|nr:radical SAM protein [Anaerolineaceae bacterium]